MEYFRACDADSVYLTGTELTIRGWNNKTLDKADLGFLTSLTIEKAEIHTTRLQKSEAFNDLEHLTLRYCGLEYISPSIINLDKLTRLDLSHNKLETVPDCISWLKHLTYLDVSHNEIWGLNDSFEYLTSLTGLIIDHNRLTYISSLEKLTNLTDLVCCEYFFAVICKTDRYPKLKNLTVTKNTTLKNVGELFLMRIPNSVETLRFFETTVQVSSSSIRSLVNLVTLNVRNANVNLITRLEELTKLQVIDIRGKSHKLPSYTHLGPSLRTIRIENPGPRITVTMEGTAVEYLFLNGNIDIPRIPTSVTDLIIRGSSVTLPSWGLRHLKKLSTLIVEDQQMSLDIPWDAIKVLTLLQVDINELPSDLCTSPTLTELELNNCTIKKLPDAFHYRNSPNLREITLRNNKYLEALPLSLYYLQNCKIIFDNNALLGGKYSDYGECSGPELFDYFTNVLHMRPANLQATVSPRDRNQNGKSHPPDITWEPINKPTNNEPINKPTNNKPTNNEPITNKPINKPTNNEPKKSHVESECCVCLDELNARVALIPCGHSQYCEPCAKRLIQCCICRSAIHKWINIYT